MPFPNTDVFSFPSLNSSTFVRKIPTCLALKMTTEKLFRTSSVRTTTTASGCASGWVAMLKTSHRIGTGTVVFRDLMPSGTPRWDLG